MRDDIIAAISTPPGEGAIAIVRVSGKGCIEKIKQIFKPRTNTVDLEQQPAFLLTLGWIKDENNEILDEVLLSVMRGPRSYSGEDMVEINCHGGILPARNCLQRVLDLGIRIAEPGEFTQRAFINGRIDAVQAEAVIDIIRAKSERGLKLSLKQLQGKNSEYIKQLENYLIEANMLLEANLDFSEDIGEIDYNYLRKLLEETAAGIDKLLKAGERAQLYQEGISIVICGKPNVGKSSLLNVLLGKEKAIVTDIPGTTRDIIEDSVIIKGIPVKIIDTAGIRTTDDLVEKIGVVKAQQVMKDADIIIFMLDVEAGITEEDRAIYKQITDKNRVIILINKDDLDEKNISESEIMEEFNNLRVIKASVKEEKGMEELENLVEEMVTSGIIESDNLELAVNLRQKINLLEARKHINEVLNALEYTTLDCLAIDIQGAMICLGEITGRQLKEESIDRIFKEFCIGK
jgi:tRNA modification GTPase